MFWIFTKEGFEESLRSEMKISRWSCSIYLPRRLYDEVCQEEPAKGLEDQEEMKENKKQKTQKQKRRGVANWARRTRENQEGWPEAHFQR